MPNLFFAKVYAQTPSLDPRWSYLAQWLAWGGWLPIVLALVPLAALTAHDLGVTALLYGTVLMAFIIAVRGDWMEGFRFVVPALPALHVLAGRGVALLRSRVEVLAPHPLVATGLLWLGSVGTIA